MRRFGRYSERKNRKLSFLTTPHLLDAPFQGSLANIHIYLTLLETIGCLGNIFVRDSMWVALQIFEQFCPKARNANSLFAEPETDFNAKRPFKVIYLGVTEEPLRDYIAQYNNCGLRCESEKVRKIYWVKLAKIATFI